ncbi:hypothetical protein D9611_000301 [Ephemerocybe angulata]|uniref:VanZ-like domain-containing protein n=1 Tax=Ephemerocybe angulata TaxID=980116 RepID=A0A8H5BMZ2_9AGAR|nr:hypothetical protein D9611_000301 [Tulosesus angulatus]
MPPSSTSRVKKWLHRLSKSIMKSHHLQIPKYNLPIRFRPWFLAFTVLIMVLLAFLGFTNFSRSLPLNDTMLHFFCFTIATGVFYWIMDVDESARRIWFWRHCGLMFTAFVCFFCGGILSEIVQAALPYRQFEMIIVVANISGSSLGLLISYYLEKYYRRRREIARLYRPLNPEYSDGEDEDDELSSAFLLPTHSPLVPPRTAKGKTVRFAEANPWNEREDVFNIGDDSDDENAPLAGTSSNGKVPQPHKQAVPEHSDKKVKPDADP